MEGNLYQYLISVGKKSEEKVNDLMQKFIKIDSKLSEKFKELCRVSRISSDKI